MPPPAEPAQHLQPAQPLQPTTPAASGGPVETAPPRTILLHSSVAFALASLLTLAVHEFCHGLMAAALGLHPVVHATYEADATGSSGQQTLVAAAGPVGSLVVALLILSVLRRLAGTPRLVATWMVLLGCNTLAGYLLTAPFLDGGDVGLVLKLAGTPAPVSYLVCLLGAAGIVAVGALAARLLLPLTPPGAPDRMDRLRSLGLLAWLVGAVLVLIALFPPQYVSIVIAVLTSGIFLMLVRPFLARVPAGPAAPLRLGRLLPLVLALVVVVLVLRVVVDPGVTL